MFDRSIPGPAAFAHAMKSANARWDTSRFGDQPIELTHTPKFQFGPQERFFCIGSCFAREIEEALIARDVDVLSKRIISPKEEYAARPNGIVNKFTTPSIVNELRWALLKQGSGRPSIVETGDGFRDLQLVPNSVPVSLGRAEQRRTYMETEYFARVQAADVLIVTLGLIETWRDNATAVWQNSAPPFYLVRREPDRFTFFSTTVAENVAALEEMLAILTKVRA